MQEKLLQDEILEYRGNNKCIVILHKNKKQYYITVARTNGLSIETEVIMSDLFTTYNAQAVTHFIRDKYDHLFITFKVEDPNFDDIYRIISTLIEGE